MDEINGKINRNRTAAFGTPQSNTPFTKDQFAAFIRETLAPTEGTRFGNCLEKSAIAIHYILSLQLENPPLIEWISSRIPDHVFAVIGRQENSDINNPTTWGEDAVVCDPWDQTFYPATQLCERFKTNPSLSSEAPTELKKRGELSEPSRVVTTTPPHVELSLKDIQQLTQVVPTKNFPATAHGVEKLVYYILFKATELNAAENSMVRNGLFSQAFNQRLNETHKLKLSAAHGLSRILAGDATATFTAEELKALRETHILRGDSRLRAIATELLPHLKLDTLAPSHGTLQSAETPQDDDTRVEAFVGARA